MKLQKILLVDDEESTVFGYTNFLTKLGYSVEAAKNLIEAKMALAKTQYHAILLDLNLPDGNALDSIPEIKANNEGIVIIVITGVSDIPTAVKAMKYGAHNFLTKPIVMDDLLATLQKCFEIEELRRRDGVQQRLSSSRNQTFFGKSAAISKIIEYANIAAMNDTVVLLLGETGTGKGVIARWIHEHSSRKDQAFVELNCSSLRGELLRSELYGHTKGAFTSAIRDRDGLIEIADGGTLFLDEIGDMDVAVQAELLKTLEERSFRRIGENKVRKSDFRLICATNRDLSADAAKGVFRTDLYYRICVFPIMLPALRNRKDDINGLIEHILFGFSYNQFPLNKDVLEMLTNYSWPGNIRELKNVIERALLLSQGAPLAVTHFTGLETKEIPNKTEVSDSWDLEEIEMYHIQKALKFFNGDKNKASSALGISLSSLYRKLEGLKQSAFA
jgi:DNA-binding NtrC family response regulator